MGNWQTRDRKRNHKHKDKQHKKFYGHTKAENKLDKNLPTIPTTIKEELECNIFLRAKDVKSFSKLRDLKDKF